MPLEPATPSVHHLTHPLHANHSTGTRYSHSGAMPWQTQPSAGLAPSLALGFQALGAAFRGAGCSLPSPYHHSLLLMLGLALATWPQLLWMARRMNDGSDDPLGLLAMLALLALLFSQGKQWRAPAPRWQATAGLCALLAMLLQHLGPALLAALAAMLALACGARALLPKSHATAAVLLLAVLALPLLASLQFFVGYPLRVWVAEATRWLLGHGYEISRSGTALQVDGHWVLVDAACSGVQLAWLGYFCAACLALLRQLSSRRLLARLPLVGLCVLLGNVARSALLVALQADGQALPAWLHEGIGLLTIVLMVLAVSHLMQPPTGLHSREAVAAHARSTAGQSSNPPTRSRPRRPAGLPPTTLHRQPARLSFAQHGMLFSLAALALLQAAWLHLAPATPKGQSSIVEWPSTWAGRPLRPLALSAVEARFAQQFPGHIARLTNGQELITWRHVTRPTRMLHPAVDCFKAVGYQISGEHLSSEGASYPSKTNKPQGKPEAAAAPATAQATLPPLWRCFLATQQGQTLRVCEQIEDAQGRVFTDTSAWYWAAQLGQSTGPWQAITVAHVL